MIWKFLFFFWITFLIFILPEEFVRWIDCRGFVYRAADNLVPGGKPFGTRQRIIWYRAKDHLPWNILYRAADHLVPDPGPFCIGPWIIWQWTVDHLVPGSGSFGITPKRKNKKKKLFFFSFFIFSLTITVVFIVLC